MKPLFFLAAAALTLPGCAGGTKCDTGDSACGVSDDDVVIQAVNGSCTGSTCTWEVTTTGKMGTVELDLVETGDPTWECGPTSTKGELVCGAWSEYHSQFTLTDFDDTTETKSLNLGLVTTFEDQVSNETTIFDVSNATVADQLTVLFVVTDANGDYADCATYGHDPSYFAGDCTNNADEW